ncbi:MAG: hypothetical protein Q7K43_03400 [Candidatus Woesearchaeota archaeon]|nr:hypothetical protein [Candidatus Woesearchaeota archaeon]
MDITQEVEAVKKELTDLIIVHLRENKIEVDKARALASDFLDVLPIETHQDLLNKLKELGEKYQEAKAVYVEKLAVDTNAQTEATLITMRDAIKQGDMEQAISAAKMVSQGGNI